MIYEFSWVEWLFVPSDVINSLKNSSSHHFLCLKRPYICPHILHNWFGLPATE